MLNAVNGEFFIHVQFSGGAPHLGLEATKWMRSDDLPER